jgi:hypothetical protein
MPDQIITIGSSLVANHVNHVAKPGPYVTKLALIGIGYAATHEDCLIYVAVEHVRGCLLGIL